MDNKKLKRANEMRRQIIIDNVYFLYNFISRNPGLSGYKLAKNLNWTTGKVYYYLQILLKDGLITNSTTTDNGRVKKSFYPKTFKELYKEMVIEE